MHKNVRTGLNKLKKANSFRRIHSATSSRNFKNFTYVGDFANFCLNFRKTLFIFSIISEQRTQKCILETGKLTQGTAQFMKPAICLKGFSVMSSVAWLEPQISISSSDKSSRVSEFRESVLTESEIDKLVILLVQNQTGCCERPPSTMIV